MLVLSLFPGIGLLDMAFELEGATVVRGPDVLWGGDIRDFHPPAAKFDGIIGGPPCQAFSKLAGIVRARGREPKFGNLIPEFERCVSEAEPPWFLMENVPAAPIPAIDGYDVYTYMLNNRQCADDAGLPATQNRLRRFSWGWRGKDRPPLLIDVVLFESQTFEHAALGGSHGSSLGNRGWDGGSKATREAKRLRANGMKAIGYDCRSSNDFATLRRKQGLPDTFDLPPFTVSAKCKAIGNGVPLPMGRAIARAIMEAVARKESA